MLFCKTQQSAALTWGQLPSSLDTGMFTPCSNARDRFLRYVCH